ncbi:hypothetical protein P7C70_g1021, partial [Phenoliferia sp. Uapishka_3]
MVLFFQSTAVSPPVLLSRKAAAEAKSYQTLDKAQGEPAEDEDDEAWARRTGKDGDFDPDEVSIPFSSVPRIELAN